MLPAHVHLPVQSGSDRVLRLMLRRYRRADYIARAKALLGARPGFTLATDIIVGFPGETEEDFQDTLSLVREVGFFGVFGFKYSPRPHTPALRLGDDIPEEVKADRLARLFEVADEIQLAHFQTLVGTESQVLVEGPSRTDPDALHRSQRAPRDRARPSARERDHAGQLLPVLIIEANKRSVVAEPIGSLPAVTRPIPQRRAQVRLPLLMTP